MALSGAGEPQHVRAMQVTPEFFPALGVRPELGRAFLPSESPDTESRAAILSHELWQGMFRGARDVLGAEIRLDGRNYTVVGVLPAGFEFLYQRTGVFTPLELEAQARERGWRGLACIARLKPGATVAQADAEVRAISERLEREDPQNSRYWRGSAQLPAERFMGKGARAAAKTMFGAVGFVLLIACANVASLLLARGTTRRRELALRASLASLVRLQLIESLLLSPAGGAVGIASALTIPLLKRLAPPDMTIFETAQLDWSALAFGFTLSVCTGVLFGIIPAVLLTGGDLARQLQAPRRGSTGGRHFLLKSLVVGEIALALVLLAASTLLIRSLSRQFTADPGFDRRNLTAAHILLPAARYPGKENRIAFFERALENLRHNGAILSAAAAQTAPLAGSNSYIQVRVEGGGPDLPGRGVGDMVVSPGYFATLRIPLLAGRDFDSNDTREAPKVAIVNQTFASRYWPGSSALGRRLQLGGEKGEWWTVTGVARDVRHVHVMEPPRPEVYRAFTQAAPASMAC